MNPIFWRNLSFILLFLGVSLLLVTLFFAFKYNYLYLLRFYFQQKKTTDDADSLYIPKTTLQIGDLKTEELKQEKQDIKPVYAEKSTATIRVQRNSTGTEPAIKKSELQISSKQENTKEIAATVPVSSTEDSSKPTATVVIRKNKNQTPTPVVSVSSSSDTNNSTETVVIKRNKTEEIIPTVSIEDSDDTAKPTATVVVKRNKTEEITDNNTNDKNNSFISLKKDDKKIDTDINNVQNNDTSECEFKVIENIVIVNSDLETINKIGACL